MQVPDRHANVLITVTINELRQMSPASFLRSFSALAVFGLSDYIGRDAQLLVGGGAQHSVWKEPATFLGGVESNLRLLLDARIGQQVLGTQTPCPPPCPNCSSERARTHQLGHLQQRADV
jgi:hypothetical protein